MIFRVIRSRRVEMSGACGTCRGEEKYIRRSLGGNLKERAYTEAYSKHPSCVPEKVGVSQKSEIKKYYHQG